MPPVLALIPGLLAGVGGAVSLGEGIASLASGGGSAGTPPAVAKPGTAGPTSAQSSLATQAGSNLIAQTGGGLSPEALAQLVGMLDTSGQNFGGAGQGAANSIYGTPG